MICIVFGTNEKWTSKFIRWVTQSPWSHVGIEYPSAVWGGRWVANSQADGVVKIPIEQFEATYPTRKVYECGPNMADGFQWARNHINADYDYGVVWNAFVLVLYRMTGWRWLWKIVTRNAAKFSCSEFVCGFMRAAKVTGAMRLDPELTPPGDLDKFCASSDDFRVR